MPLSEHSYVPGALQSSPAWPRGIRAAPALVGMAKVEVGRLVRVRVRRRRGEERIDIETILGLLSGGLN